METGVKPYPSCRWGHAGIDAALELRAEHNLEVDEIESATLGISRAGMLLIGEPAGRKADPRNIVDGQFSGPFVIAVALATGKVDWDSYQLLSDPTIRKLLPVIRCEHDAEVEAEAPRNMSGRLTIHARGQTFTRMVVVPKGEPTRFPTEAEVRAKFLMLVTPILGVDQGNRLADLALSLDSLDRVGPFLAASIPT
jgi:2-methylcitrate dehydratase PrpD